jgi:hypothetical protein
MTSMTVPERISDFLSQRQERMYCDTCIQERLGLKWRQQVQLITATLAVTAAFRREFNKCCTCDMIKQVTHATGAHAHSIAAVHKASNNPSVRGKRLDARFGAGRAQGVAYPVSN